MSSTSIFNDHDKKLETVSNKFNLYLIKENIIIITPQINCLTDGKMTS